MAHNHLALSPVPMIKVEKSLGEGAMFIDYKDELARLNPVAVHAMDMIGVSGSYTYDGLQEARRLARHQVKQGRADPKHWVQVYAVLNGETHSA